jgi:hypothetical protein
MEQTHEKTTPVGIRFKEHVLTALDSYASAHFNGDRTKALNYILEKALKAERAKPQSTNPKCTFGRYCSSRNTETLECGYKGSCAYRT